MNRISAQTVSFANYIASLNGWKRFGLAFALGILSAFAFAPYFASPLLWIAYPVLLWQMNGATTHRQAFLLGWAFGFGQFVFGFYWISVSMFTDIARWWWAVPFASTALPALFAFNTGFAAILWWRMRTTGPGNILLFAAWMMIGEWSRGHLFTGFPWNLTADTWVACVPLLQSLSVLGSYGLGLITIAVAAMPSLFGLRDYPVKKAIACNAVSIALLAALALWGWHRIPVTPVASVPGTIVRLVQPNIAQTEKWTQGLSQKHFTDLLLLSHQQEAGPAPTIVVWPETASPYLMDQSPEIPRAIAFALPQGGIGLIGSLRRTRGKDGWDYYNSLQVLDSEARLLGHYDKTHLVPYGEYMPFRRIFHLDALAVGTDLTAGNGPVTLTAPGLPPVSPMICYETIFSEQVTDPAHRPAWLLQITNDAWFGDSSGPYQDFAMAQARAVEQGLPLLRAANTGISGAIDPYGRILASLPLDIQGVLDVALPQALSKRPFYARHGDLLFLLMICGLFLYHPLQRRVGKFFLN